MPAEYCEFISDWEKVGLPWVRANCPEVYPELFKTDVDGALETLSLEEAGMSGKKVRGKSAAAGADDDVAMVGGKKAKKEVVVERVPRNKKKSVTTIRGLEHFGVKLSKASKHFGTKVACGCAVKKFPGNPDGIEMQGDNLHEVAEEIVREMGVPEKSVFLLEDKERSRFKMPDY
jgi:density-regulated protein DRP1